VQQQRNDEKVHDARAVAAIAHEIDRQLPAIRRFEEIRESHHTARFTHVFDNGAWKAPHVFIVEVADRELTFGQVLRLQPVRRDGPKFGQMLRDFVARQNPEAQAVPFGASQDLAIHLARVTLERDVCEHHVRFLSQLEEVVAAVVEHWNPVERHLVERRTPIELARKRKEGVEERRALAERPHDGI
jgi:hypothetical protein